MTPYQLCVLAGIFDVPRKSDGTDYEIRILVADGLVRQVDDRFVITRKGHAHIHQLCLLPLPQEAYTGADGKLIEL